MGFNHLRNDFRPRFLHVPGAAAGGKDTKNSLLEAIGELSAAKSGVLASVTAEIARLRGLVKAIDRASPAAEKIGKRLADADAALNELKTLPAQIGAGIDKLITLLKQSLVSVAEGGDAGASADAIDVKPLVAQLRNVMKAADGLKSALKELEAATTFNMADLPGEAQEAVADVKGDIATGGEALERVRRTISVAITALGGVEKEEKAAEGGAGGGGAA